MPHIHTKHGQHDLTTTAFILRIENGVPLGFLHRHKKLGLLLPAGGHVELYETPWAAVLHEIVEESGYEPHQLKILQPRQRIRDMSGVKNHPVPLFLQTHEFKADMGHFHSDIGFVFVTDQMPVGLPKAGESNDIQWLSKEQMSACADDMPADIYQIYDFCFTTALLHWERLEVSEYDV